LGLYDSLKEGRTRHLSMLPRQKLPEGVYLVHNNVLPPKATVGADGKRYRPKLTQNGFRAWVIRGRTDNMEPCDCDFGRIKNSEMNNHYRVAIEHFEDRPKSAANSFIGVS
jgi:hypothetical protein